MDNFTTSGKAELMLLSSHIKRTSYVHQVTTGCLKILLEQAYQQYLGKQSWRRKPSHIKSMV